MALSSPENTMDSLTEELDQLLSQSSPSKTVVSSPSGQAGAVLQLLEDSRRQNRKMENELLALRRKALEERKKQNEVTSKFASENKKLTSALGEAEETKKRLEENNRMLELHNRALRDSNKLLSKDKAHLRRENRMLLKTIERLQERQQRVPHSKQPPLSKTVTRDVDAENQALNGINALLRQELHSKSKPVSPQEPEEDVDCDFQSCIMDETMDEGDRRKPPVSKSSSYGYRSESRKVSRRPSPEPVDPRVKLWTEMQRAGWKLHTRDTGGPRLFVPPGTNPRNGITGVDMFVTFEEAVATHQQRWPSTPPPQSYRPSKSHTERARRGPSSRELRSPSRSDASSSRDEGVQSLSVHS
mmetsp:Transcript_9495/g.16629  ORF Transcript_9495/g.16629 Transcript_9495/m.16629 type:complete len:358 (+) Transcript_9495:195-1268(+)